MLIVSPVPAGLQLVQDEIETHIALALVEAARQNVKGKLITPFLLQYIAGHTRVESLQTSIGLILNNAKAGAGIAVAFAAAGSSSG